MWSNPQFQADFVTFTEEIFNAKNFIFCAVLKTTLHAGGVYKIFYVYKVS